MSRRGRKSSIAFLTFIFLTTAIAGVLAARWYARQAALSYGLELQSALFDEQAPSPDGVPRKPRDVFNEPKMLAYERTLRAPWNIVAADYLERAEDLRTGIVYLHIQLRDPATLRFAHPPKLRHFKLETANHSDAAVQEVMHTLLDDYLRAVGSR